MKKAIHTACLCSVCFLFYTGNLYGQSIEYVIDKQINSYEGVSYKALNSVTLLPGFEFKPTTSDPSFSIETFSEEPATPDVALNTTK